MNAFGISQIAFDGRSAGKNITVLNCTDVFLAALKEWVKEQSFVVVPVSGNYMMAHARKAGEAGMIDITIYTGKEGIKTVIANLDGMPWAPDVEIKWEERQQKKPTTAAVPAWTPGTNMFA
jgi:hypothetical protein